MGSGGRLAPIFCENAGVSPPNEHELEAKLAALIETGRGEWAGVALEEAMFVAHLARHARQAENPIAFLDSVHAADLYLACAVLQRDEVALTHLDGRFIAQVGQYVVRITVDRDQVDEIKQQMRERIVLGRAGAPKIAEYSGKGALGGWMRITAIRTALNLLRGQRPTAEVDDEPGMTLDPELVYLKARAKDLFRSAFVRVLGALAKTERAMLRLHYVEGLTMDQLSRMYKIPRSTVARRVDQVRKDILESTEQLLKDESRLSASEVASVIRGAASQLHLTLTKILK